MNLSEIFIRRPVATTLLMLGILLFGVMGYRLLPVSDLPNVDFPTIVVTASLPGASPETMASSVATPLERQFTTIAGIDTMSSTSTLGITRITIQFALNRNLDAAAQDVQTAISNTVPLLPKDMPYPPSFRKVNPADQPILYLALTSPTMPLYQLNEYGDTLLSERISTIDGVAEVLIYGSQKFAVRVQLDPLALASRGLGINEVAQAVSAANANLPTGTLYGRHKAVTIRSTGQLTRAKEYNEVIVAYSQNQPVKVEDVGLALDSVEDDKTAAWYINQRSIVLAILRQPGTNTVEVANAVKKLLPVFRSQLPASVSLIVLFDRSESIRQSVNDVKFTLIFTLSLVVIVIFLFLRRVRATIIPSLAMPMSIVGTFGVMYFLNYSLDNLSLMALILSVGFVVDDAIVMLENIIRHGEMGESGLEAALNGSREISFTIVSMTLSLAAVFIPVLFMGGIIGRLFREFAVAIVVAVMFSGFVALTLTPMLSRFLLLSNADKTPGRFYRASERVFDRMRDVYSRGLRWFLGHGLATVALTLAVLVGTVWFFQKLPKGFIPSEDTGQMLVLTEANQGISYESMIKHQQAVAKILEAEPDIKSFMSAVGGGGPLGQPNVGIMFAQLKPRSERKATVDEIITELRPKMNQVPGITAYLQNPPPIRIGGTLTRSLYQYTLQSPDTQELYRYSDILEQKMRALPILQDVTSDLQIKNPQVEVVIDRNKASLLGLSATNIETALSLSFSALQISTIFAPHNYYQVILELAPDYQLNEAALLLLYLRSNTGNLIPLNAVAHLEPSIGPVAVNHLGQLPSVTISFNTSPGVSLGQAVGVIEPLAKDTLPATITTSFQGTAQAFQSSLADMNLLLIMAVMVIYIVLGILYESFIHPITILSALPFAGFGALVTLYIFHSELNIYAFVGVIMLIGLVKKNGIMMVDFAMTARREGLDAHRAIYQACLIRFRPIMMTTMAALMGTLPIAIGFGAGGPARRPLGLAVVGGLIFSQFLTLFVTPVFYLYMERLSGWLNRLRRDHTKAAQEL